MNRCLIIGGGIAGLTAASILASKKIPITLLESSPKLGGRTYSFIDSETNTTIDNGQHILMGCYSETLKFMKLINAEDNFEYQRNLRLNLIGRDKTEYKIESSKVFYPFNLLFAIANYNAFTISDKFLFIKFLLKLLFLTKKSIKHFNVAEWLKSENQNDGMIKKFWEILCIGALNTSIYKASAVVFYDILIQIFFRGNFASTIILPKKGLTESIIDPAVAFIRSNGGEIITSKTVKNLEIKNKNIIKVVTENGIFEKFDYVISAIPNYALQKVSNSNELIFADDKFEYSTIVNIHVWIDNLILKEKFYGFLDSPLHWIFVKDGHFNIVISDANHLAGKTKEEIYEMVSTELFKYLSVDKKNIVRYKIVNEKRATFVPHKNILDIRPNCETEIKNLFLAGDWTNTVLPSTIESAAKSGRIAAECILSKIS